MTLVPLCLPCCNNVSEACAEECAANNIVECSKAGVRSCTLCLGRLEDGKCIDCGALVVAVVEPDEPRPPRAGDFQVSAPCEECEGLRSELALARTHLAAFLDGSLPQYDNVPRAAARAWLARNA